MGARVPVFIIIVHSRFLPISISREGRRLYAEDCLQRLRCRANAQSSYRCLHFRVQSNYFSQPSSCWCCCWYTIKIDRNSAEVATVGINLSLRSLRSNITLRISNSNVFYIMQFWWRRHNVRHYFLSYLHEVLSTQTVHLFCCLTYHFALKLRQFKNLKWKNVPFFVELASTSNVPSRRNKQLVSPESTITTKPRIAPNLLPSSLPHNLRLESN